MAYVDYTKLTGIQVGKPFERELKAVLSPDTHDEVKDFSFLVSTLSPRGGCTDFHSHDEAGELMIFLSGRGEAWLDGKKYELKPGVTIYAPRGIEHKTLNTGDEPMQIACVFVPAISTDYIVQNVTAAQQAGGADE